MNAVAPGPVWTPLQVPGGASMAKLESFGGSTPPGRPGQPADAGYVTGRVHGAPGGSGRP